MSKIILNKLAILNLINYEEIKFRIRLQIRPYWLQNNLNNVKTLIHPIQCK